MGKVCAILTLLALGLSCFVPRILHAAAVPVCCVCSGCPTAATICVLPPAGDTAPDSVGNGGAAGVPMMSACEIPCNGCASVQFVLQSCSDVLQCQQPVHAPATSHRVLLALGVGLAAYGVSATQRARRRLRDRRFNSPAA
jgi:hypothetical protein